jgi:hypothetical protein
MCGSAEGLVASCNAGGGARLYSPDELGHLLEKAQIERASFTYVLNRAFYDSTFSMTIAKQKMLQFDARLSIVGGLTVEKFEDLFSAATTAGFYDRFVFGHGPGKYLYNYNPFETRAEFK